MKKTLLTMMVFILLVGCNQIQQKEIQLTGPWHFEIDNEKIGIQQKWFENNHDFSSKLIVENLGDWESLTGPGYDGWGWYFTDFNYNQNFPKSALHFLSVDDNATVWLNGSKVGIHYGANEAFKMDVSKFLKKGRNRLTILIEDTGGGGGLKEFVEIISFKKPEDLKKGKYFNYQTPVHPQWATNAVIYELNTRQFSEQGTFRAVEERLDELQDLGVKILWFMPIHPIGEINRKGSLGSYYAVKNFYGINPEFGTLEDFKRLVQKIHQKNMYVIIDLVANHTAWDNPLIKSHPEWYSHDKSGKIISPVADWADVADLNYENRKLWAYMIDAMKYWVEDIGIDGYRCDVAGMVPTEFWIEARKALDKIKPVFMLAEAETPELNAFGFDMTYASTMFHLFNDILNEKKSVKDIDRLLEKEYYLYPKESMRMRFTSNHDENTWAKSAIKRMGVEGAKAGAVLTFTLPGTPLIYNGQECGNTKDLAFFDRDPIQWSKSDFRPFYTKLTQLYKSNQAIHSGKMEKLNSDNDDQIYAFARTFEEKIVLIFINFSNSEFKGKINLKSFSGQFEELFSRKSFNFIDGNNFVELKPWQYQIFIKK